MGMIATIRVAHPDPKKPLVMFAEFEVRAEMVVTLLAMAVQAHRMLVSPFRSFGHIAETKPIQIHVQNPNRSPRSLSSCCASELGNFIQVCPEHLGLTKIVIKS